MESMRLEAIEAMLQEAVRTHDSGKLERMLAPDFRFAGGRLGRLNRTKWIAAALAADWHSFEFIEIDVVGDDRVRVAQAVLDQQGELDGQDIGGRWILTDTWIRAGGAWTLLARHVSPV